LNWFTASTGGASIGTGASFTTPSISATTTYYVSATNSGCTSARTAVVATVNQNVTLTSNPANAMNGLAGNALLTGDNGISAYHSNEIGAGFSDNYSFIDNPSGGLTHSYTFIEEPGRQPNMENGGMPQMGISSNADKQNEKETMMNKAYEELLAQRKHDLPIPIGAMRT
jgi:hypothetical protein